MQKAGYLFWTIMCLLAFPALARAEQTACDLLTKADVEAITGMQVTATKLESLGLCAGFCISTTGTRCVYTGMLAGSLHDVYLAVEFPPYAVRDIIGFDEDTAKQTQGVHTARMRVLGLPALWFISPKFYAFLHIVDGGDVHFLIGQDGIPDDDVALHQALSMADRVYGRYKAH